MKNLIATIASDELASAERTSFKIAAQLVILTLQSLAIAASFAFRYHRSLHRLLMLPTDAQAAREQTTSDRA
jgi:energy-coupling factor transporter transmembrane protein EcfT